MGSWKEYRSELNTVEDNLPYGGLIKSNVLRGKDDSYLGCIAFDRYLVPEDSVNISFPELRKGWSIWTEHQHTPELDRYLFYLSWNPFNTKTGTIKNLLGKSRELDDIAGYFQKQLGLISDVLGNFVNARILEYNDFLEALNYSVSFDAQEPPKPDMPLYLDYYLLENVNFKFLPNDVLLNDKKLIVVTLSSFPAPDTVKILYKAFAKEKFRHVKRLLVMNEKEYINEMREYMRLWCSGRKAVKNFITDDIFPGEFHGYATENLIFLTNHEKELGDYIFRVMDILELPYILESFNLKDVWWGSLPGLFRANVNPPALSIKNIYELLFPINKTLAALEV